MWTSFKPTYPLPSLPVRFKTEKKRPLQHVELPMPKWSAPVFRVCFHPSSKKQVLINGGILENIPVNTTKDMGAHVIIGADLNPKKFVLNFYFRSINIKSSATKTGP